MPEPPDETLTIFVVVVDKFHDPPGWVGQYI